MSTCPRHAVRTLAVAALTAAGLALTGCGPQETDTAAENGAAGEAEPAAGAYAGPYDQEFANAPEAYAEQVVTLVAEVHEIVSPVAVAITDRDDPSTTPLLVVLESAEPGLEPGDPVEVTGTLHEAYNVPATEEGVGEAPDEDVLAHYDGRPYVQATRVEGPVPDVSSSST